MNILTFDIEEWFHILNTNIGSQVDAWDSIEIRIYKNMDTIFRLLEENNCNATFFCLGWIARKYPEIIKKINMAGYEVATHSDLHQLAYTLTPEEFKQDLHRSIGTLENITGNKVRIYRAPGFSLKKENKWVFDILLEEGIEIDCSVFPAKRDHGGFEEFGEANPCFINVKGQLLKEFPINIRSVLFKKIVYSGGGYFRLFPLNLLKKWFNESSYTMAYFHPRDFDVSQPKLKNIGPIRSFKLYYGLGNCYYKLNEILKEVSFCDINTADNKVNWNEVPIVKL